MTAADDGSARRPAASAAIVRPRRAADLDELVALLALTHEEMGYPVAATSVRADWIAGDDDLGAWVAERDGGPVAHIALHPAGGASLPLWRAGTGVDRDAMAVISRFFSRAPGAGTALLDHAVGAARGLGRVPVLEVQRDTPAHGYYLRRGWTSAGEVEQRWGGRPVVSAALVMAAS